MSLLSAIETIAEFFANAANTDEKLTTDKLKELLCKECASAGKESEISDAQIERIMKKLDKNKDGEINLREFLRCISQMCKFSIRKKKGKEQEEDDDD